MGLRGQESGVNNNAESRGIFIHGTPQVNYQNLGDSASHGCVREIHAALWCVFPPEPTQ